MKIIIIIIIVIIINYYYYSFFHNNYNNIYPGCPHHHITKVFFSGALQIKKNKNYKNMLKIL